jgi:hypothetical protein
MLAGAGVCVDLGWAGFSEETFVMPNSVKPADGVNVHARSPGESVHDVLAKDRVPPRTHYLEPSYVFLGDEDIPIERYLSREWHDLEVRKVWKKTWQVACREEDIPNPGDYIVYDIVDDSVLVARMPDGSIKAYINACLHRGTELCVGQGQRPRVPLPLPRLHLGA